MPRFFERTLFNTTLRIAALVAAIVALALCASCARSTHPSSFSDVADDTWYGGDYGCVVYVVDEGIMTGYAGTSLFGPDDTLSRAQAVTALYRTVEGDFLGLTSKPRVYSRLADKSGFSDTADGEYYTAALNWAVSEDVIQGHDGLFRPNDSVTREELVTMAGRAVDNAPVNAEIPSVDAFIADADQISEWATPYIDWGFRYIIHGEYVGDSEYLVRPLDAATRAECALVLMRLKEYVIDDPWM